MKPQPSSQAPCQLPDPAPAASEIPTGEAPGIWPVIKRKLDARKWKLNDLAQAVSLPADQLQELLNNKGYEVHTGLKWIREREQETAKA